MKKRFGLIFLLVLLTMCFTLALSSCDLIFGDNGECTHDFTDWEITEPATCVAEGVRTRECTLCGESEEEKIPKNASHDYGEFVLVEENDCQRTGKAVRTCKKCADEDVAYLLGNHKAGAWVSAKEPTLLEDGCVEHSVCTVCAKYIDRDLNVIANAIIPKLSNNISVYINGVMAAPLKVESSDTYVIKLISNPIDVKKGDVVTICQTDNPSVKYEYTVTFNSSIPDLPVSVYGNINEDGTVRTTSSSVVSLIIDSAGNNLSMGGYRYESGVVAVVTHSALDQAVMIPLERMAYPADPDKQAYIFGLFEADERLSVNSISIIDLDSGEIYGFADLDMEWNTWSFGRGSNGEIMFKGGEADWWLAFDLDGNKRIELHKLTKPSASTNTDMVFPNGDKFDLDTVILDEDDAEYLYYTFPVLDGRLGNRSEYGKYISGNTLSIERIEFNADAGAKFYLSNSRDSSMAHENLSWVSAPKGAITVDTKNGYIEINTKGRYIIDYVPYSMSVFIYYVEEEPTPDPTPEPEEGMAIEINGKLYQMGLVTYPDGERTAYIYGYVELNAGDKLLIKDLTGGFTYGFDDISSEMSWNIWDYHRGENGEIVIDFAARYAFEFYGGDESIYIQKVFAPVYGDGFEIVFDDPDVDSVEMGGIDISVDPETYDECMFILLHESTMNASDIVEFIEKNGLYFYSAMIEVEAGSKFCIRNTATGAIINADHLSDVYSAEGGVSKSGDYLEILMDANIAIIYLPSLNAFTLEVYPVQEKNDAYIYINDEIIPLMPDEYGYVAYESFEAGVGTYITMLDGDMSFLPITLDPDMDSSLVELIVEDGVYSLWFNEQGTYSLYYDLVSGLTYIEQIGAGTEEDDWYDLYYVFLSVVDYTNGNQTLTMDKNPDDSGEAYVRVETMAAGSFIAVGVMEYGGDYSSETYAALADTDSSIATSYGSIIMVSVAGPIDVYFDFAAKTVRIVPVSE